MQIPEGSQDHVSNGQGVTNGHVHGSGTTARYKGGGSGRGSESDSDCPELKAGSTGRTCTPEDRDSVSSMLSSQPPSVSKKMSHKKSVTHDYKVEELRNEIRDLERRLKNTEYENQTLKRIQVRHERELLKAESSRHDDVYLNKPYVEEVRALRRLLSESKDKHRDYEKRLQQRHAELQRLKLQLSKIHQAVQERDALLEKEEASLKKIGMLETELRHQETEVEELRRKLDLTEKAHKDELEEEKSNSREIQKKLVELRNLHHELHDKMKSAMYQNGNLRKGMTLNGKEPKDAFNSYVMSLDQERKERLLAKLREIDLNGQSDTIHCERIRSPRRHSMESAHLYGPRTKSPVRRASRGTYNFFEGASTSNPATSSSGGLGRRTMSDTFPRSSSRRKSFLENLQEIDAAELAPAYRKHSMADIFGSSNLRPEKTSKSSGGSGSILAGDSIFPELSNSSKKSSSQSLFPWEQKTNF
ncbi:ankyrin repeat domain-containing protein 26-like [Ornithodoros turicata]|uniref:ankyrin repeat domain-containing protein 26-like n=1 Tax=Ornithodoros turicata TaxID=34597 RepID=UPI0031387DF6